MHWLIKQNLNINQEKIRCFLSISSLSRPAKSYQISVYGAISQRRLLMLLPKAKLCSSPTQQRRARDAFPESPATDPPRAPAAAPHYVGRARPRPPPLCTRLLH